jgi:hypothetical protein
MLTEEKPDGVGAALQLTRAQVLHALVPAPTED